MKLSNFLMGTLVCAMAAACTNDSYEGGNENNQTGNGEQAFIAVKLMAPNAMTKAPTFQDGTTEESTVSSARFYFFNNSGTAVTVSNSVNYVDVSSPLFTDNSNDNQNIDETSTAILVLNNADLNDLPTKMAVVLNPPTNLGTSSKSLTELSAAADDYASAESGKFVMSNSVYIDNSTKIDAVDISANIAETSATATNNPAVVYVERVLARVDVKQSNNSLNNYSDNTEVDASEIIGYSDTDYPVMAKVIGWGLANQNSTSYLIKQLDASWSGTPPFTGWNDADNHRSYWAKTSDINSNIAINPTYESLTPATSETVPTTRYCQERTDITAPTDSPTELLVIAQLQINNTPQTIGRYAGQYYLPDDLMTVLLAQAGTIYIKSQDSYSETDKIDSWTALGTTHVKLRPAETGEDNVAAYEAVLDLKDKYANSTNFQFASDSEGTNTMELTAVEKALNALKAQLWYEGRTYYHVPITHDTDGSATSTDPGRYGVVRNHLYNITVSGITGLGTPIPGDTNGTEDDPDDSEDPGKDPIDPEDPEDNNSYLAAQINILSWNVISQDVTLGDNN